MSGAQTAVKKEPPKEEKASTAAAEPAKAAKPKAEVVKVKMADGREVEFAGKRKMLKEVLIDHDKKTVKVRFDFRNGETRTFEPPHSLHLQLIGHGASQKVGDETAGEEDIDDMVVAVDEIISRLGKGEWSAGRVAGDGFSGASVVIRAISEVTGKTADAVKAFLQKKLDEDKAKGGTLTRNQLYASFRNPTSKTGQVIERLERDKKAKNITVNADEMLKDFA